MAREKTLNRFIEAQEQDYSRALTEIKQGRKRSHWMWYIFPQINGLGFSETSKFYGIKDLAEAEEYLSHPILGSRLLEISTALLALDESDALKIFGSPDNMKLKSSMTLFASIDDAPQVFKSVLNKFFNGETDSETLKLIKNG
ncbi:DUF1810 domain-containing protein [Pedobacter endophyticus]|uniref:DUF1810 domain-containing protein n=1 Tax=Pedobacter endophyticus TaxID=2789740 RepID=A0A7S9KZA6_9SPHI|nr:DUF1810 domain-containing protein [Pedobacter endophyticus]QPH39349.1 DUF1810 domain-containing protein [Pedobacter endophyticus]